MDIIAKEARVDRYVGINGAEAMKCARDLARQEGLFVGTTAGATFAGALQVARDAPPGTTILCMLPDTGERYLSTPLFADIAEGMTDEELEISRSTPGYRFDVSTPASPAAAAPAPPPPAPREAIEELRAAIQDPGQAVVMFALEWCEFCWAVRKLFAALGIRYESVDLDSVALQERDMGTKIRAVLKERTGSPTIPQIYIGASLLGGCTDLFDAMRSGKLLQLLNAEGVTCNRRTDIDPYAFLPKWVHPRKSA